MAEEQHSPAEPGSAGSVQTAILGLQRLMYEMEMRINKTLEDKHRENRLMNEATRDSIQAIVNANYLSQQELAKKVDRNATMLATVIGDGEDPNGGRLGRLEASLELLKQFRWQALAVVGAVGWGIEHFVTKGR